jgi:hypothetical protein
VGTSTVAAFSSIWDTETGTGINACRHLDQYFIGYFLLSGTIATVAWIRNNPALSTTAMTGCADSKETLRLQNLTLALAHRANLLICARLSPCCSTRFTCFAGWYLYFLFGSKNRLSEADAQIVKEISARAGSSPLTPTAVTKAEEVLKYVSKSRKDVVKATKTSKSRALQSFVAELVIDVALL